MKSLSPKVPETILLVDDEVEFLKSAQLILFSAGYFKTEVEADSTKVLERLRRLPHALLITDLNMPSLHGKDLLESVRREFPGLPVLILSANNDLRMALDCLRAGAHNFLVKPVEEKQLVAEVEGIFKILTLQKENESLKEHFLRPDLAPGTPFEKIITQNSRMIQIMKYLQAVSDSNYPVLITGETGTGKELFAEAVHRSRPGDHPFVVVNAAGLDDNLFSDTLFGHKKGAFTGADGDRPGMIEKAGEGTLFLDEIGDLSAASQVKLLRLVQNREYFPLGSDQPRRAECRMVFATHQNLDQDQGRETFRKDLYFRLKTHHIHLPSLRERPEDIPLLFNYYFQKIAEEKSGTPCRLSPDAALLLQSHAFPGNIRELESLAVDLSFSRAGLLITPEFLHSALPSIQIQSGENKPAEEPVFSMENLHPLPSLKAMADKLVKEALRRTADNQSAAAAMLGITRQALNKRLHNMENGEEE